jgi:hypothetical protein
VRWPWKKQTNAKLKIIMLNLHCQKENKHLSKGVLLLNKWGIPQAKPAKSLK